MPSEIEDCCMRVQKSLNLPNRFDPSHAPFPSRLMRLLCPIALPDCWQTGNYRKRHLVETGDAYRYSWANSSGLSQLTWRYRLYVFIDQTYQMRPVYLSVPVRARNLAISCASLRVLPEEL
jgi:hypothetical protein